MKTFMCYCVYFNTAVIISCTQIGLEKVSQYMIFRNDKVSQDGIVIDVLLVSRFETNSCAKSYYGFLVLMMITLTRILSWKDCTPTFSQACPCFWTTCKNHRRISSSRKFMEFCNFIKNLGKCKKYWSN